jgi:hypothetical protein
VQILLLKERFFIVIDYEYIFFYFFWINKFRNLSERSILEGTCEEVLKFQNNRNS